MDSVTLYSQLNLSLVTQFCQTAFITFVYIILNFTMTLVWQYTKNNLLIQLLKYYVLNGLISDFSFLLTIKPNANDIN